MELNRQFAPEFKNPEIFPLPAACKARLSNGIEFFEILEGTQPALKIEFIFNAGHLYESKRITSFFTSKLLSSGTLSRKANEIEEEIASFGAFHELSSGQDHSTLTVYCLAKYLRPILKVVKDILTNSVFPEEELQNLKHIQIQNLKVNKEKTSYLATTRFRSVFFENHPYSTSLEEDLIESITRKDVLLTYQNLFCLSNCKIFVSGGGSSTLDIFEEVFSKDMVCGQPKPSESSVPDHKSGFEYFEKADALQTSIRVGLPTVDISSEVYPKMSLLNEILGGYFGSRLMKNIREDKGYTYGIHSSLVSLLKASYLIIGTDVKKEVFNQTLEEIHKEIKLLKTERVDEKELQSVKNYMIGSYLNSINSPFSVMERYKIQHFHNLPNGFFENFYASLRSVSSDQIIETANQYLDEESFLKIAVG